MNIQIAPLPAEFIDRVRSQGVDDQGQPVRRFHSAEGGEPCRDVLRRARPGEELILASFCPFDQAGPYKEFGPIFVLANPTGEPITRDVLPLPHGSPEDYLGSQFVLRAYSYAGDILDATLVAAPEASTVVEQFLDQEDVAFVDARFPAYGCFACRIGR